MTMSVSERVVQGVNYLATPPASGDDFEALRSSYQFLADLIRASDGHWTNRLSIFAHTGYTLLQSALSIPIVLLQGAFQSGIVLPLSGAQGAIIGQVTNTTFNVVLSEKFFLSIKIAIIYLRISVMLVGLWVLSAFSPDLLLRCIVLSQAVPAEQAENSPDQQLLELQKENMQLKKILRGGGEYPS